MRLKIKHHPGYLDFPELRVDTPKVGEVREFPNQLAARLLKANIAEAVEAEKAEAKPEVMAIAQPPIIAAPKSPEVKNENKPAPLAAKVKQSGGK